MTDSFLDRNGFPRSSVTLANWRTRPFSTWSFVNVGELVPTARIDGPGAAGPRAETGADLLDSSFVHEGEHHTVRDALQLGQTDSLLVMRGGAVLAEWHASHARPDLPHLVFSVTKSVTGLLAGALEDRGALDPGRLVTDYLPDAAIGGFSGATVRHLLDMRVSLDFTESYLDRDGDYGRYRRAMLWNPPDAGRAAEPLPAMLCSIPAGVAPHGGPFHYHSPVSDMLGLVLERAAGSRLSDLFSELIWQPLGASDATITVDGTGAPRAAGGLSATPEDLARLGQMMLEDGAVGGHQIVSPSWLADLVRNGDREAWDSGNYHDFIVGGRYRNQWYGFPEPDDTIVAIGIHGQYLHLSPSRGTVIVKLSSQALPQDDRLDLLNLSLLDHLSRSAVG